LADAFVDYTAHNQMSGAFVSTPYLLRKASKFVLIITNRKIESGHNSTNSWFGLAREKEK